MAAVRLYKLDDEESCPSNCFPIRSFLNQRNEGAGHWLVAHRNAVEQKYRRLRSKKSEHCYAETTSECTKLEEPYKSDISGNILDGVFLMTLHCVDKASDLCSADISEQKLHSVKMEDLEEFDNVAYINASDNSLTLEPFSRFPTLRELELSLNSLRNLTVHAGDFPYLEMLDLSYNNLSSDDIMSIGLLPCLKVLHLTGNQLQMLPPNMAAPHHRPDDQESQEDLRFHTLEVLILDDNKLSSGVFSSLANLKRLQHLNLQGNYISEVPCLQQMGPFQDLQNSHIQHSEAQEPVSQITVSETLSTKEDTVRTNGFTDAPKHQQDYIKSTTEDHTHLKLYSPSHMSINTEDRGEYSGDVCLPLPELRFLNLANNEIVEEEALLAVALFPMLNELVIHSNPLTTQRSGDPPMLTCFLQDRLGIKIRRMKTPELVRPHIVLPVNPKRKVKTKIPKVPKVSWIMASPCSSDLNGQESCFEKDLEEKSRLPQDCKSTDQFDCSSQIRIKEHEEADIAIAHRFETLDGTTTETPDETHQDGESFFVTEVNGLHESEYHVKSEETEELDETTKIETTCPKKFRGYEILLDAKPDPDLLEPVGIQHTVRALEQTLKSLLVYRDSKVNLDHLQKPYTEKKKKIGKLPPVKPRRLKGEKVEEILTKIKERRTISEVPLDKVLKGKDVYKKEYEEALTLLRDMKKKYKIVHSKAVEQATRIERTTNLK